MTILHDLVKMYNETPRHSVYFGVIAILLKNLSLIPSLSLEKIAELCNTSTITINRLMKKLNCSSFRAFKEEIADVTDGYSKYNRVLPYEFQKKTDVVDSYFSYFKEHLEDLSNRIDTAKLEKICEQIHAMNNIHIYTEYASSHAKKQFQVDLTYSGKRVFALGTIADQEKDLSLLTPSSLVIATSFTIHKYYSAQLRLLKKMKLTGATVVVISGSSMPYDTKYADYTLVFKNTETAFDNFFIDMIFNLLTIIYRNKYID